MNLYGYCPHERMTPKEHVERAASGPAPLYVDRGHVCAVCVCGEWRCVIEREAARDARVEGARV